MIKFQNLSEKIKINYKRNQIGKTVKVLFENKIKNENKYFGRDEHFNSVVVEGNDDIVGNIKSVKISKVNQSTLFGKVTSDQNQTNYAA